MTDKIDLDKVKRLKYHMSIGMSTLIVVLVIIITVLIVGQSNEILTKKVAALAYDLNLQTNMNLENYVDNIVAMSTYMYANENYVNYDPMDGTRDEKQRNELESEISTYLFGLCVMGDYADLCVAYRTGTTAGKITEDTRLLFKDGLFSLLEHELDEAGERTCWITGYNEDYNRIYYLRRLNENAIYMSSFYTSRLENVVMQQNNTEANLNLRLLSEDGRVIYSRNIDELGMALAPEDRSLVKERMFSAWVDDNQLAAITQIKNGWMVIANARTSVLLKQRNEIITYVVIVSSIGVVIAMLITIGLSVNLIVPSENLVRVLYHQSTRDSLTGFFNKKNFEGVAKKALASSDKRKYAFLYLDINDLKGINARRGHEFGDKLIMELSEAARVTFGENSAYGRTDGDEFVVLCPINETSNFAEEYVERQCLSFRDNLQKRLSRISRDDIISLSIGVVMIPDYGRDYDLLYDLAERAVYANKQESDTVCHFYDYARDYNIWKDNKT